MGHQKDPHRPALALGVPYCVNVYVYVFAREGLLRELVLGRRPTKCNVARVSESHISMPRGYLTQRVWLQLWQLCRWCREA